MTNGTPTILVTGASGNLGRRVVELLLEQKAGKIVAMTRDPARIAELVALGAEARRGDFDDPASLAAAFAGVERLLLISTDAVGRPGGRHEHHSAAVDAAVAAGVKHIVYTSGPAPHPDAGFPIADDHYWTEHAVAATPGSWTILRNSLYAEVALGGLVNAVGMGRLVTAAADGGRSYVTREDCARVAAAVLAAPVEGRRILDVTGPAPVTQADLAAIASDLTGKIIARVAVSEAQLRDGLRQAGLPPVVIDMIAGFDRDTAQGYYGMATPVVEKLTGRKPTAIRAFLEANRAALLARAA